MSTPSGEPEESGTEPRTVYVSDALQARLDGYREHDADRTATSVTFEAIEYFHAALPELVRTGYAQLDSPVAEPGQVRYLGAGPVRVRLRPSAGEAKLLDKLSTELDLSWRTWIPPVLNAYLPGRREPENMPWLVTRETSS